MADIIASGSPTSPRMYSSSGGSFSCRAALLLTTRTRHPSARSSRTRPRPMKLLPPITTTSLFNRDISLVVLGLCQKLVTATNQRVTIFHHHGPVVEADRRGRPRFQRLVKGANAPDHSQVIRIAGSLG